MENGDVSGGQDSGEEGLEKPQSIETAKGPWLARRFKPLPADQSRRRHRSL